MAVKHKTTQPQQNIAAKRAQKAAKNIQSGKDTKKVKPQYNFVLDEPKKSSGITLYLVCSILLVITLAAASGPPLALHAIQQSLYTEDEEMLYGKVDFDNLENNLYARLTPESAELITEAFGEAPSEDQLDHITDLIVTITARLQASETTLSRIILTTEELPSIWTAITKVRYKLESLSLVTARLSFDEEQETELYFQRTGLNWKLVDFSFPDRNETTINLIDQCVTASLELEESLQEIEQCILEVDRGLSLTE